MLLKRCLFECTKQWLLSKTEWECWFCAIFSYWMEYVYKWVRLRWSILKLSWWRHQMETFSALLVICAGNSPVPGEFPTQRPVTRSFHVFFDLPLNKRLSNYREAGDLRGYRAHYDVTVMMPNIWPKTCRKCRCCLRVSTDTWDRLNIKMPS